jgi:UPF0755 protein
LVVVLASGFAALVAAVLGLRWIFAYPDRPLHGPSATMELKVAEGATFGTVLADLRRTAVVRRPFLFRMFANSSGMASRLRPGTYTLRPGMTPRQLLEMLVKGPPIVLRRVTVPEGKNMLEVARLVAEAGVCQEKELVEHMRSRRVTRELGIPGPTVEGYLFPDTYKFRPGSPPMLVLKTMVRRHRQVLRELKERHPSFLIRLRNRFRFDDHQIVIMASLVEKETGVPRERPLIAGVFLNRLSVPQWKTRKLETDPTIVYGCTVPSKVSDACRQWKGRIQRIHLNDAENPYNTYQHAGLPPGPIANPGRDALTAVIRPAASAFLFFVSKNDGSHHFSATFEEHNRAVDRYQRSRPAQPASEMAPPGQVRVPAERPGPSP